MSVVGVRECTIEELAVDEPNALCIGPFGSDLLASDIVETGVPVVFVRNIRPGRFKQKDVRYVTAAKADKLRAHRVRPGDIVITKMGLPPCIAAAYPDDAPDGIVTADIIKLTPDRAKVDTRYLVHFINSSVARAQVKKFTFGVTRPKVTLKEFRGLRLSLPSLAQQSHIADVLDRADAICSRRSDVIALTEELLRSAFLQLFGDPVGNPKGWNVRPLGELAAILSGGTPSRGRTDYFTGPIPWATAKDFKSDVMVDAEEHVSPEAVAESATQVVPAGTVLVVVKSKILLRRLPVAVAQVPLCFNQDVKGLVPHIPEDSTFIATHLRLAQRKLLELARGVNTEGLTVGHLRSHAVMQPPRALLATFAAFEGRLRESLQRETRALREAQHLFESLAHRSFAKRTA
jgi:type I restriction enzyme, S subunit